MSKDPVGHPSVLFNILPMYGSSRCDLLGRRTSPQVMADVRCSPSHQVHPSNHTHDDNIEFVLSPPSSRKPFLFSFTIARPFKIYHEQLLLIILVRHPRLPLGLCVSKFIPSRCNTNGVSFQEGMGIHPGRTSSSWSLMSLNERSYALAFHVCVVQLRLSEARDGEPWGSGRCEEKVRPGCALTK